MTSPGFCYLTSLSVTSDNNLNYLPSYKNTTFNICIINNTCTITKHEQNEITFVQLCGHSFKILNKFQSYPTKSKERHHLDDFSFALLSIGKLNATDMLSWCLELFAYWGWTCYEHIWSQVISTDNVYYHWSVHTAGIVWKPIGFW